jgi:F-box protein 21
MGVIIGWDEKCEASDHWKQQMGIEDLPNGANQPYYTVLVDARSRPNQTTYGKYNDSIVLKI